jgi:tetratricopeptide (TPR) repeat protein
MSSGLVSQPKAPTRLPCASHLKRLRRGMLTLVSLALTTAPIGLAAENRTFVAFSMKAAQAEVQRVKQRDNEWRKSMPALYYLGYITKPMGIVIDRDSHDWILIGQRDEALPLLTLDDWVVALQSRFAFPDEDPGVTINPICPDKREYCRGFLKQEVHFFAGVQGTHFARVCYEADWLMKRIGLGLEKVPVEQLQTYFDLSRSRYLQSSRPNSTRAVMSRFWFYPVADEVGVFNDVILLEQFQMGVFTQVLHAEVDGKPLANPANLEDYASDGFSRSFTASYDAIAASRPVLEELRGLTRLSALAKGMTRASLAPSLDYFLKSYLPAEEDSPSEVGVLTRTDSDRVFSASGGVRLMALALKMKAGDTDAIKELVLRSRPDEGASNGTSWGFSLEFESGTLKGVTLPTQLVEPDGIAALMSQGLLLIQNRRYDAAIQTYGRAIDQAPGVADLYFNRGVALYRSGRLSDAIADFQKSLTLNPEFLDPYNALGAVYLDKGQTKLASEAFDKALSINNSAASVYYNRSRLYRTEGQWDLAISDLQKVLSINPRNKAAEDDLQSDSELRNKYLSGRQQRNIEVVLKPAGGKVTTEKSPILHFLFPNELNLVNIQSISGRGLATRGQSQWQSLPNTQNTFYLPAGTYNLTFAPATFKQTRAQVQGLLSREEAIYELKLPIAIDVKQGYEYTFWATRVLPQSAALSSEDESQLLYGVIEICVDSRNLIGTEVPEHRCNSIDTSSPQVNRIISYQQLTNRALESTRNPH